MSPMRHALLARLLTEACGGQCESAKVCRLERSRLGDFANPNVPDAFMPADVIADLEAFCGKPIYSRALLEEVPPGADSGDPLTEACELTEKSAALQRLVREAGPAIGAADRQRISAAMAEVADELLALAKAATP